MKNKLIKLLLLMVLFIPICVFASDTLDYEVHVSFDAGVTSKPDKIYLNLTDPINGTYVVTISKDNKYKTTLENCGEEFELQVNSIYDDTNGVYDYESDIMYMDETSLYITVYQVGKTEEELKEENKTAQKKKSYKTIIICLFIGITVFIAFILVCTTIKMVNANK